MTGIHIKLFSNFSLICSYCSMSGCDALVILLEHPIALPDTFKDWRMSYHIQFSTWFSLILCSVLSDLTITLQVETMFWGSHKYLVEKKCNLILQLLSQWHYQRRELKNLDVVVPLYRVLFYTILVIHAVTRFLYYIFTYTYWQTFFICFPFNFKTAETRHITH